MSIEVVDESVSTAELGRILGKLRTAIQDDDEPFSIVMGSLALAMIVQRPELTVDQIIKGVSDMSQWLAYYLEAIDGIPKERLN